MVLLRLVLTGLGGLIAFVDESPELSSDIDFIRTSSIAFKSFSLEFYSQRSTPFNNFFQC